MSGHICLPPLILASGSPRRDELMKEAGYDFTIVVPEVEEAHEASWTCEALTMENARRKASVVARLHPGGLAIGADTLVYLEGDPLGKPKDLNEAAKMLERLQGRTHQVCTGVALVMDGEIETLFSVISEVTFKSLSREDILSYHSKIDPLDKAGAYAIQEESAMIIESISGSWSNVKGLPMERLEEELAALAGATYRS